MYINSINRQEIEATLELMKKAEHDLNQKQKHLEEWELRLLEKEKKLERKKKYMVRYIYFMYIFAMKHSCLTFLISY